MNYAILLRLITHARYAMPTSDSDGFSLSQTKANLFEAVAPNHLERESTGMLIADASKGLADVSMGRFQEARSVLSALKQHRANKMHSRPPL